MEERLGRHPRPAIGEGDEHDSIAMQWLPVPGAVLAHEGAATVRRGEGAGTVEGQAQRSGVGAEAIVDVVASLTRSGSGGFTRWSTFGPQQL